MLDLGRVYRSDISTDVGVVKMIFTHHGNNHPKSFNKIGGRIYSTVQIGDQIWLAENLDYQFAGCDIGPQGTPNTPAAWYFNNEPYYGVDGPYKIGLYYNWYAVDYLNTNRATLCPGWHVPTQTEWNTLLSNALGQSGYAGTALKVKDNSLSSQNWPTGWYGDDDYGFGVVPGGRYDGTFGLFGTDARYWTANSYSSSAASDKRFTVGANVDGNTNYKTVGYSLRLVRD